MKLVNESVFISSLRAFFVAFFGMAGATVGLVLIILGIYGIAKSSDESPTFSSGVKILPDAEGQRKELSSSAPVLLQINLKGKIGQDHLTAKKIQNILLKSREDELKDGRVKGILLVINSPGGATIDSDIIYRYLKQYKDRYNVPIYAYIDGICASGGYYIACTADKIVSSNISLVGSIGVLAWPPFFNVSDTLEKLGINTMTLYAGKGKEELNPLRPWKPGEQETYQKLLNFYYERFVEVVTESRPEIDHEQLVEKYGAEVFPAPLAKELGYIDETDYYLGDALTELAQVAGIKEDEKYQVITFETKNWLKRAFKMESPFFTGKFKHELQLPSTIQSEGFYYLFGGM